MVRRGLSAAAPGSPGVRPSAAISRRRVRRRSACSRGGRGGGWGGGRLSRGRGGGRGGGRRGGGRGGRGGWSAGWRRMCGGRRVKRTGAGGGVQGEVGESRTEGVVLCTARVPPCPSDPQKRVVGRFSAEPWVRPRILKRNRR